jgi:putative ABC transport system substrate-binding protein
VISRRNVLVALAAGAVAAPLASFAQPPPAKLHRIGFLGMTSAAGIASRLEALRAGLRDLGYVEGKNLVIEFRWADGDYGRLPALAAELARIKVDLIVTHSVQGTRAAKQATATIPIVVATTGDAVATRLVASEGRPGGNVTGLSSFSPELSAKRLELLKETFPRIRRAAVLWNPGGSEANLRAMEVTARSLKLEVQTFAIRNPGEFERAFAAMSKERVEAVAILEDAMIIGNAEAAASLAARHRIPSIGFTEVAEAGGLMAYGVNTPAMFRRAAVFVDKILKGANPGDLPIERATKFELVVNLKAATALGVTIPQSILLRADRVIE